MAKSRICSIPNCGKPAIKRGWCSAHYQRWRKRGDALSGGTSLGEPLRYFQEVVLTYEGEECLFWPYAKNHATSPLGYARLRVDGRLHVVSRLVCEHVNGPPPTPKHEAAHSCGNGHLACVAKKHLSWKTRVANQADRLAHGTHNRGTRQGQAKLTEADVRAIREGAETCADCAKRLGVSYATVQSVLNGRNWAWLS